MGNTLNVTSCVECMDDNTFPRPPNGGGMCESNSMKALPSQSLSGNQIPITTETVNHIVELSVSKPLGVTLCDSSMVKGVFVTVIKSEGNIAKLSQKVSVGMKLIELNGVDVSTESLESVIKKISDSPPEKRLILRFQGTAPAEDVTPPVTTLNTTSTETPAAASKATSESVQETQKEDTTKKSDETAKTDPSSPAEKDTSLDEQEEEVKEEDEKSEVALQLEEEKDKKSASECQHDKTSVDDNASVSTPEKEDFGDFASSSMDTGHSLVTVEMSSPAPVTPLSDNLRDSKSSKDLEEEFSNINLADNTTPGSDMEKVDEVTAPITSSGGDVVEEDELYDCCQCEKKLTKDSFTGNQFKKKAKRKCKACCANKQN